MTAPTTSPASSQSTWQVAISIETLAYVCVFALALVLRAFRLGAAPLSASEAHQALAAWHLLNPGAPAAGGVESPLLFAGAFASFAVAGVSNAAARLLPLLGGLGLVLTPLLLRRRIGRLPALAAVAWLALSPVAVAASRRMTGAGLAMLALLLALAAADAFLVRRKRVSVLLAGVALGAALLADFGALAALVTVALGLGLAILTDEEGLLTRDALRAAFSGVPWATFAVGLAGTFGLISSLFMLAPGGLGAAADQLARFFSGFAMRAPGAASPAVVLALYEPGLVAFGLIGAWLATQSASPWQRLLAGWGVAALGLSLFYPGSLPDHALWAVVPLAMLAGLALRGMLAMVHNAPQWGVWAQAAAIVALVAMLLASLTRHLQTPRIFTLPADAPLALAEFAVPLDLVLVSLWVLMLVIQWFSVASLWGPRAAWLGTGLAALVLSAAIGGGQSGALTFTRATSPFEPANVAPAQPALDRLAGAAREVSNLALGHGYDARITAQGGSALAWALRDFNRARFVASVDPRVDSPMVITPAEGVDPALGSSYVGQDFVIVESWQPRGLPLKDVLRWAIYRRAPTPPEQQRVILWVREDIYRLSAAGGLHE